MGPCVALAGAACVLALAGGSCSTGADARDKAFKEADYHYKLAHGFYGENEHTQAMAELITALDRAPDHVEAHHLMALVRMGRREFYEAMTHLEKAIALKPDFHEARNNLGATYLALCRFDDARTLFEALVREPLYSTPWLAHNNLGWADWNLDRREEAIRQYKKAVFFNPKFCMAFNNLGLAYLEEGRYDDAERQLREALRAEPSCEATYAEPHLHLARLFERKGDAARACEELQACVTKAPPGEEQAPAGCGHSPVGLRCVRKAEQLACPQPRP